MNVIKQLKQEGRVIAECKIEDTPFPVSYYTDIRVLTYFLVGDNFMGGRPHYYHNMPETNTLWVYYSVVNTVPRYWINNRSGNCYWVENVWDTLSKTYPDGNLAESMTHIWIMNKGYHRTKYVWLADLQRLYTPTERAQCQK